MVACYDGTWLSCNQTTEVMQHQAWLVLGWVTGAQARLLPCEEVSGKPPQSYHVASVQSAVIGT